MWLVRQLTNHYQRAVTTEREFASWPKVAVVLSLRGNDPHLESCLQNLVEQEYENFELHVVVDSETDPAWEAINAVRESFGTKCMNVSVLRERRSSCSLKNSSIIQAVESLPSLIELVAFVDADAITYPTWLRDLVVPFTDPEVGCTSGVRWYAPSGDSFGAKLRFHWNAVAGPLIFCSDTPWGGSMVVRRTVLDSGLTDEWSRMFCEDAHTINHLRRRGFRVVCVPQVTIINNESTTIAGCIHFVNRQTFIFRLYNRRWWNGIACFTLFMVALKMAHALTTLALLAQGQWLAASVLVVGEQIGFAVRYIETNRLHLAIQKRLAKCGRPVPDAPQLNMAFFVATDLLLLGTLFSSFISRRVKWRGIYYHVMGPESVRLDSYRPFILAARTSDECLDTVI